VSFSDPAQAFGAAVDKLACDHDRGGNISHPHRFRANHGEARARELEFIVNSRLSRLAETAAINDKISSGTSGDARVDDPNLARQNTYAAGVETSAVPAVTHQWMFPFA
jgi:hypothetical protein